MSSKFESGVFGKGIPAWHGLGLVEQGLFTAKEALTKSGMDYKVELRTVLNEQGIIIPGIFSVTRMDTFAHLGFVTERYNPFQNEQLFEIAQEMEADAMFETAIVLDGGAQVATLMCLNREMYIGGEEYKPYFMLGAFHNGKGGVHGVNCTTRVVCSNTFSMAMRESTPRRFSLRHVGDWESRIEEARKSLNMIQKYADDYVTFAEQLLTKKVSQSQIEALVNHLIPMPEDADNKRGITMAKTAQESLRNCIGADDLVNIKGSAWGLVQATIDFSDHERRLNGADKDQLAALERAFTRTVNDTSLKDKALDFLVAI